MESNTLRSMTKREREKFSDELENIISSLRDNPSIDADELISIGVTLRRAMVELQTCWVLVDNLSLITNRMITEAMGENDD